MIPSNVWCASAQKVRYPNEKVATEALQECLRRGWNQKFCYEHHVEQGGCGGWHLTKIKQTPRYEQTRPVLDRVLLQTYEPFSSRQRKPKRIPRAKVSQTLSTLQPGEQEAL